MHVVYYYVLSSTSHQLTSNQKLQPVPLKKLEYVARRVYLQISSLKPFLSKTMFSVFWHFFFLCLVWFAYIHWKNENFTEVSNGVEWYKKIFTLNGWSWHDHKNLCCECLEGLNEKVEIYQFHEISRTMWTADQCSYCVLQCPSWLINKVQNLHELQKRIQTLSRKDHASCRLGDAFLAAPL